MRTIIYISGAVINPLTERWLYIVDKSVGYPLTERWLYIVDKNVGLGLYLTVLHDFCSVVYSKYDVSISFNNW